MDTCPNCLTGDDDREEDVDTGFSVVFKFTNRCDHNNNDWMFRKDCHRSPAACARVADRDAEPS